MGESQKWKEGRGRGWGGLSVSPSHLEESEILKIELGLVSWFEESICQGGKDDILLNVLIGFIVFKYLDLCVSFFLIRSALDIML